VAAPAGAPMLSAVSADQPALVLFVMDRSVADPYAVDTKNACTRLHGHMGDMVEMIAKFGNGAIDVGVISYGTDAVGETEVRVGLEGPLTGNSYARDNQLLDGAVRIEEFEEERSDGAGGILAIPHKRPVLVEVEPTAGAPATPAFEKAAEVLDTWSQANPGNLNPPIVIHLTRGQQDLADMENAVGQLQSVASGAPVALYHVVETEDPQPSILFPGDEMASDKPEVQMLCKLSSPLLGREELAAEKPSISEQSLAFVLNGRCNLMLEGLKRAVVS
jgi:hypothetical protein